MVHLQQTNFFGRCCSYPQGHVSFFPQLIATAALVSSWAALPWTPWFPNYAFMCIEYERFSRYSSCYTLDLVNSGYWNEENDEDDDHWAWAIQLAAVFGILALTIGAIAFIVLMSALCFAIEIKTLRSIAITFIVSSCLSLLTLIALAVDVCHAYDSDSCDRKATHLREAAVLEIFACVFFAWAAITMFQYAGRVREGNLGDDITFSTHGDDEQEPFVKDSRGMSSAEDNEMQQAVDYSPEEPITKDLDDAV